MFRDYVLYVDNFRGFSDSYIPVRDVNFLVGENSTGKTSILSLLKLLSEDRFILFNQSATDEVDLGMFRDIVSSHADDPSYFRVGLLRRPNKKGASPIALLFTYRENEGLPIDVGFSCTYEAKAVTLRRVEGRSQFAISDLPPVETRDLKTLMKAWASEHDNPQQDYKSIDRPIASTESLMFPFTAVANQIDGPGNRQFWADDVFPQVTWIAPIRTKPRRTYDELRSSFSSEGAHTPYSLRRILDDKAHAESFSKAMRRVGSQSGLFDSVQIKKYGDDITAPFEVQIVLHERSFGLMNVGYGVSQALPVLTEILWRPKGSWMAIQQPEVHLHPKAQAAFGDLVFAASSAQDKKFIIETHSDFLIDRFRSRVRKSRRRKPESQILFFERKRGKNIATPLRIDEDGQLPSDQPRSYRSFFINEAIESLGI